MMIMVLVVVEMKIREIKNEKKKRRKEDDDEYKKEG